ncbi:MAG TPA: zf-HC2 domain-containing protein [Rhodocyclaceae bacterium]|nr:zf-HC2 domain-containing protein [Rhodocyclaceae bacterium]
MDCSEAKRLVPISIDRELDARDEEALAAHIASCAECRSLRQRQQELSAEIRRSSTRHQASASLRERIVAALPAPDSHRRLPAVGRKFDWKVLTGAGVFATACAAFLLAIFIPRQAAMDDGLADELVASHARALLTNHVIDIASTDQHTVKPWFNGRVDFSPPVRDLAAEGFPLVGGRLDYVDHHLVAVVVYKRRHHFIDVFIWPADRMETAIPALTTAQGYHLLGKTADGMTFRAVSDVDAAELRQLVGLL